MRSSGGSSMPSNPYTGHSPPPSLFNQDQHIGVCTEGTVTVLGGEKQYRQQQNERRQGTFQPVHGRTSFCILKTLCCSLQDSMAGDAEVPPNRYWPSPGGVKAFLRPFIERNQEHLWAYDPVFVGMNHQEAYRYTVGKVRTLATLWKLV